MKFVYNKYFHSEQTSKHFDQCGSHDNKKTLFILVALASLLTPKLGFEA